MPLKIDDCLARAAVCEAQAEAAAAALKERFLQMANQWRELAKDASAIKEIRQRLKQYDDL
jgi:hypothetical protein